MKLAANLNEAPTLASLADAIRLDANRHLATARRPELGQHLTPAAVARLMADMLADPPAKVRLLDPGAGVGSLTAAAVESLTSRAAPPQSIQAVAFEVDEALIPYLHKTLALCATHCAERNVHFEAEVRQEDFIATASGVIAGQLFAKAIAPFTTVILNPPYKKIQSGSDAREQLRAIGLETTNLYTGFLACAAGLLDPGGDMVAITPRSFCNGLYFRPFRERFLTEMAFRRMHVFESRSEAFRDDAVLQENVVFSATRSAKRPRRVNVTSGEGVDGTLTSTRSVPYDQLVHPSDPEKFIRIVPDELGTQVAAQMATFGVPLADLGLQVSTGRVVDFRALDLLRLKPRRGTVPLLYPTNLEVGSVTWPKETPKAQALADQPEAKGLLVPNANYVLVKRFSAKEERRRVVASVYEASAFDTASVGFENHLNYFHANGAGIEIEVARGLAAYLNSTMVDSYFRQFSGHTQVNATDLRTLRYPDRKRLIDLGCRMPERYPAQAELDRLIEEGLFDVTPAGASPARAQRRLQEALGILKSLGFPRAQQNERSALALLALLDLVPERPWSAASDPLRGITQMMKFFEEHYGKAYAPNTRETVRRQTVHQFRDAGLVVENPDQARATNSGKFAYQIEPAALELVRSYGTPTWDQSLATYVAGRESLSKKYAQARTMRRIPVKVGTETITLSAGGQNVLMKLIVEEFAARFTPGGKVLYLGDTDEKFVHFDEKTLVSLGVKVEKHGKMPDVVIYFAQKKWLVLVEAVTSHGPVNPKRHGELKTLFKGSKAGLVLVTAFADRRVMAKYLPEISWETEVWTADAPDHLIHFNGERFLGPY